jgi:hypothetical protein
MENKEITVDFQTAFNIGILEFDKKITAAELEVARLKNERANFIFDKNVQCILNAKQQEKANEKEQQH